MAKKGLYANIHAKKKKNCSWLWRKDEEKRALRELLLINSLKELQKQLRKEKLKKGNNYV